MTTAPDGLRFRRLTDDDLPLLHRWLNDPEVVRWWEGDDVSWPGVVHDYGSANPDPVEHWLALLDDDPVAWLDIYDTAANEDEDEVRVWRTLGVPRDAAGVDYLIGDPSRRGHGLGSAIIAAFVDEVVFAPHRPWTSVYASPQAANVASCGALRRAGFTPAGSFEDPTLGTCLLFGRQRPSPPDAGPGVSRPPSPR